MGKTYRPTDSHELERDLKNSSPNDTILLKKGVYYLDRIFSFDNLTIQGGSDNATETIIRPTKGRAFRCKGGSLFKNFSAEGGGSVIEAEGHGTTIKNFISWMGNEPVKLAGDDHLFDGGIVYGSGKVGVDINGGFYYMPEISKTRPVKLKTEVLKIDSGNDNYTQAQKDRIKGLFYHRNMNTTVQNVVGIRCGYRGGMTYGGFIKAVPNAGGITLKQNFGIENVNDYWNDFPSEIPFSIYNNVSLRTVANAIFVEGYIRNGASAEIYNNLVLGANRALFVSAFPYARSWGNKFYFRDFGKVIHGLTGNRINKAVGCITPDGFIPDTLISLSSANYRAHHAASIRANYDFTKDVVKISQPLDRGAYKVEATSNNLDEFSDIENTGMMPLPSYEELIGKIDPRYRLPRVLNALYDQKVTINTGGESPDLTPIRELALSARGKIDELINEIP